VAPYYFLKLESLGYIFVAAIMDLALAMVGSRTYRLQQNSTTNGHCAIQGHSLIQGHRFWYRSKARMQLQISE